MGEPTDRRESLCRSILPSSPIECKMENTVCIGISSYFRDPCLVCLFLFFIFIFFWFVSLFSHVEIEEQKVFCYVHDIGFLPISFWNGLLPCLPEKEKCQQEMYSGFDNLEQWGLNANGSTMLHLPVQFYFHSGCCCHIHIRGQKEIVFY